MSSKFVSAAGIREKLLCLSLVRKMEQKSENAAKEYRKMEEQTMKSAFNIDNPFFALMGRLADYVILNLLFLLTACPVITIGTALCAMHEVLPKMAEGTEGSLYRTYMQAFIRNFRRTVPVWLFLLITGVVLVFDVTIAADSLGSMQKIILPVVGSMLIFWLLIFSWIFLMEAGSPVERTSDSADMSEDGSEEKSGTDFSDRMGIEPEIRKSADYGKKPETDAGIDIRRKDVSGENPAVDSECVRQGRSHGVGIRGQIKAALFAAVTHLPQTLLMIVLEVFPIFCYIFVIRFFLGIVLPFYVCIGFSLSAALCSILAGRTKIRPGRSNEDDPEGESGWSDGTEEEDIKK